MSSSPKDLNKTQVKWKVKLKPQPSSHGSQFKPESKSMIHFRQGSVQLETKNLMQMQRVGEVLQLQIHCLLDTRYA